MHKTFQKSYKTFSSTRKAAWKCEYCRNKTNSNNNNGTQDKQEQNREQVIDLCKEQVKAANDTMFPNMENTPKHFQKQIYEPDLMQDIKNALLELQKTVLNINKNLENLTNATESIREEMQTINVKINELQIENNEKTKQITALETKINNLEQQNLANCIEISNATTNTKVSAREAVLAIARAANITMVNSDVLDAYHLKNKNKIVAKLSSLSVKRELMQNVRERKLSTQHLNLDKEASNVTNNSARKKIIYVNDQLTAVNKKLLWLTKNQAKSKNWKFVWVKDGKILAKKTENSSVKYIYCETDIEKIN